LELYLVFSLTFNRDHFTLHPPMQRVKTQGEKSKISYTRCRTLPRACAPPRRTSRGEKNTKLQHPRCRSPLPRSVRRGGRTSCGEKNTKLQYELKKKHQQNPILKKLCVFLFQLENI